ncbi:hypothetical protein ACFOU0_02835 [Salinicoccus sesuvii]|uniref:Uncharacterized protein n=1 Tax=Salinicoccus sesuvii TaxID=868281 RepID=A0ABV7N3R1_9STAP
MKEIKVNMTNKFKLLCEEPIRTKNDILYLLLESILLLTYGEKVNTLQENYLILRIDKMKRLFFVLNNKIFSFYFPFSVIEDPVDRSFKVFDQNTRLMLEAKDLLLLKTIISNVFDEEKQQAIGIQDFESEILILMKELEIDENQDIVWNIIKKLLKFEVGYLRYDYDEKNANGELHPLNHLDINYLSNTTFKIGLDKSLDNNEFVDLLDLNTNCYFIKR